MRVTIQASPLFLCGLLFGSWAARRVAAGELDFGTGLLIWLTVQAGLLLVGLIVTAVLRASRSLRKKVMVSFLAAGLSLLCLEVFLRAGITRYSTYGERNRPGVGYISPYRNLASSSWLFTYNELLEGAGLALGRPSDPARAVASVTFAPNERLLLRVRREFEHSRQINRLGLAERELDSEKQPGEYRIVALGDSFTEGMGAPYESTWPQVTERHLRLRYPARTISFINAGIAGSDICYQLVLLSEVLLRFDPDLVIVAVNSSDVDDLIVRGGMERFRADGTTAFTRSAPEWEWLYAVSYLARLVVHELFRYDKLLLEGSEREVLENAAATEIVQAVGALTRLARDKEFSLLVVFHPHRWEIEEGSYARAFEDAIAQLGQANTAPTIDLLAQYSARSRITPESAAAFYWEVDGHHNADGYAEMGTAIAEAVIAGGFLSTTDMEAR